MDDRIVILGGGHGVAAVVSALRDRGSDLTVIVSVADDGGSSGELRRLWGGPAIGDLRRSLIALAGEQDSAGRALEAPVQVADLGPHPLGNLVLCSLSHAFGDLRIASLWLTRELGLSARALPATVEPVTLVADGGAGVVRGESAIGSVTNRTSRITYDPPRPRTPADAMDAIAEADYILLAPGSLFTSVLAVAALPDITPALSATSGRVVWICALEPENPECCEMSAADHLAALHRHGVRVDTVLFDPSATLHLRADELEAARLRGNAHPLMSRNPGRHDPGLLGDALSRVFAAEASRHVQRVNGSCRAGPWPVTRGRCEVGDVNEQLRTHTRQPSTR